MNADPYGTFGIAPIIGIGLIVIGVIYTGYCFELVSECIKEVVKSRKRYPCDTQKRWNEAWKTRECKKALR